MWHIFDVRAVWVNEFATALSRRVPVLAWLPKISWTGFFRNAQEETWTDDSLQVREFPLQRGFYRFPLSLLNEGKRIRKRIERLQKHYLSPLVFTTPHYFRLAAEWPGPRIYYVTDMFRFCGQGRQRIEAMEQSMGETADLVCPNSRRIAHYLVEDLKIAREKIVLIPNATRASNVLAAAPHGSSLSPADMADLPRPIAGVVGNLAANLDWQLLDKVIRGTQWLSWVFVGPAEMSIDDPFQERARAALRRQKGRVRFLGPKPYRQLQAYARALDVAILPYRKREPTYSGSSTRFYEHLAACRPMIATLGFEELLDKEPLLTLADGPEEMIIALQRLRSTGFCDGYESLRWEESRQQTWEARAELMRISVEKQSA